MLVVLRATSDFARTSEPRRKSTPEVACFVTLGREPRAPSQPILAHIGLSLLPTRIGRYPLVRIGKSRATRSEAGQFVVIRVNFASEIFESTGEHWASAAKTALLVRYTFVDLM